MFSTQRETLDDEVMNEDRAGWAEQACLAFAEITGQGHAGVLDNAELDEVIGDLLGNLQHLAAANGFDWAALLERGQNYFVEEVAEETDDDEGYTPTIVDGVTIAQSRHIDITT